MISVTEEKLTKNAEGHVVTYAKGQKEYDLLPVIRFADGKVYSEWTPTKEELSQLMVQMATGHVVKIRLWQWTFNHPLQPVALEVVPL